MVTSDVSVDKDRRNQVLDKHVDARRKHGGERARRPKIALTEKVVESKEGE